MKEALDIPVLFKNDQKLNLEKNSFSTESKEYN